MQAVKLMLVLAAVLQAAVAWASGPFQVISTTETRLGDFTYVKMVVQNGADPRNRFEANRVRKHSVPDHALKQPIILMPSLATNFTAYMVGTAPGGDDFEHSTAAHL